MAGGPGGPKGGSELMKNSDFTTRLGFALHGIRSAWRHERSLRSQAYIALALVPLMLWLQPQPLWWAVVGVMVVLVLAAELFNTALEQLADHLHPEQHPAIGLVKDCAAGAVLLLSLGALWAAAWMVIDTLF